MCCLEKWFCIQGNVFASWGGNVCAPWGNGCVPKEMLLLLGVRDACAPKEDVCAPKGDVCAPMKLVVFHEVMFAFSKEGEVFAPQGNGYVAPENVCVALGNTFCVTKRKGMMILGWKSPNILNTNATRFARISK